MAKASQPKMPDFPATKTASTTAAKPMSGTHPLQASLNAHRKVQTARTKAVRSATVPTIGAPTPWPS